MKIYKYFLIISMVFFIGIIISEFQQTNPIEDLAVHSGIGYDAKKTVDGVFEYDLPISVYIINPEGNITSKVYGGKAMTLPRVREARQRKLERKFIVGFEKVYVFGEDAARIGIRPMIDILMKSQWVNDNGYALVYDGSSDELLKLNIEGSTSAADYLDGMIYSSRTHDFFAREYSLISLIQTIDAEGKNAALPYVKINETGIPEITGMAIFNNDKMFLKLDIQEMRMMNMMRNDKVYGVINIRKSSKEYVGFETSVRRKVKCYKENGKFKFVIDLTLNGNVVSNTLYRGMANSPELQKRFEKEISSQIKEKCEGFIDKMQHEYKMDMINLSEIAIGKYGRHTGVNWDEAVSDADIEVNIKAKVDQNLRGEY